MSEIKKPSIKSMSNMKHLGRFTKDKFIQQGHNSFLGDAFDAVLAPVTAPFEIFTGKGPAGRTLDRLGGMLGGGGGGQGADFSQQNAKAREILARSRRSDPSAGATKLRDRLNSRSKKSRSGF